MKLRACWIFLLVVTCSLCQAQHAKENELAGYFYNPAVKETGAPYFLLKLLPGEANSLKTKAFSIIRQVDRQNYIVSMPVAQAAKYHDIFPANNLWKLSPELFE